MAYHALNLPIQLMQEAEAWAARQGVALNEFILWAVKAVHARGILLAAQARWTMPDLIAALDRMLSQSDASDWPGHVRWLNEWRT